jgi:hypothetical protein
MGYAEVSIHMNDNTTEQFNIHPVPGTDFYGVNILALRSWIWLNKPNAYALRDALNEILEGVPTPPEDEVIGLTNDKPFVDENDPVTGRWRP